MRPGLRYRWCLAGAVAALSVSAPTALRAGCCAEGVAPAGYAFDAFYARKPIYLVNQGPVYSGPGIYAVPTYTAGGYAYKTQYPYVNSYWVGWRYGYGSYRTYP